MSPPSPTALVVRWPLWMRLPGLGVALGCLAAAAWLALDGPDGGGPVPWLLVGVGLLLGLGLAALPWRKTLRGDELEERSLLGRRRLRLGPGARVEEREEVRNFLGGVRRLTVRAPGGEACVLESYERGYHALRDALEARGWLPPAPEPPAPVVPARFVVAEIGQDRGGLGLLAAMGFCALGLAAYGLWTQAGPLRLLAGLGGGLGAWLTWRAGAALLASLCRLEVDGARLAWRGPLGRLQLTRRELAGAEERLQWNGCDRTLTLRGRGGARVSLDSGARNYALLRAWLRAGGVPLGPRPKA